MLNGRDLEIRSFMDASHEKLQRVGFSDPKITVAAVSALLGAREVLAIHGASQEILQTVFKADAGQTPRTVADLRSGEAMRGLISINFPDDRINEEETGDQEGRKEDADAWHVDPLDGTSSFAEGLRCSTVGVAIYRSGKPFASVIVNPYEQEMLVAQANKGAYLFILDHDLVMTDNASQGQVSSAQTLRGGIAYIDALFNHNTVRSKLGFIEEITTRLAGANLGIRMSGSNIDQQLKVAVGRARLTLTDAVGGFFDLAAGGLAIIEAGGKFTDQHGNPVDESTQLAIGSNGPMHDDVLEILNRHYRDYRGFR